MCFTFAYIILTFATYFAKTLTITMYAIVDIAGQQVKVQKDRFVYVNRLSGEPGAALTFDKVLLVDNGGEISVGLPTVSGATISAKILEHVKGE